MTSSTVPGRPRIFRGARTRILAGILLLLVLSEAVALILQREILLARAGERVDSALVQEVDEFRTLVRLGRNPNSGKRFGNDVAAIFDVFLSRNVPGEGEAVFTFLGESPYRSTVGDPDDAALRDRLDRIGTVVATTRGEIELDDGRVRYLAVPVEVASGRGGAFVVTADLGREEAEISDAVRVGAGVSLIVLLAAGGLAWMIAGRVLAPLRDLTDTARSITDADFTQRIKAQGQDEIAELARTFNAMLDRLQAAFAAQKDFVSDAGHELRTPITIIRGHLELLGDDPAERRETVELVCDELDRMSRFVDDLLLLAQAEQADFIQPADVDLDALTEELLAKAGALALRDWQMEANGVGRLQADRQRLTQAMMQLAQNAVQHTEEGDRIALGSALENGHARLWVSDSGPGVPAAERERIFDRFARGSGARRSQGAGLGLAIVRAIAEAHGGTVELESTRPGAGATFIVTIPTRAPAAQEAAPT